MNPKQSASRKIVFPHIMKTGGTSLIAWIQRHYFFEEILYSASVWEHLRATALKDLQEKKFVRGHFGSGILNVFGQHNGFTPIALVRDPVERAISHYWHLKRASDQRHLGFAKSDDFTFEAYLDHPGTRYLTSNYQTASYSAVIGEGSAQAPVCANEEMSPVDVDRAKAFIDSAEVVGTTAELGRFVEALSRSFGFFPGPQLKVYRSYRERCAYPDELVNRLRSLNEADYELYHYVRERASAAPKTYSVARPKNPNAVGTDGKVTWRAGMPFWGHGWSEPTGAETERHVWSVDSTATIEIDVKKGDAYVLFFAVARFVVPYQAERFVTLVNGREIVPTRIFPANAEGPQLYTIAIGRAEEDRLSVGFKLQQLISFRQVNENDPDTEKRGLALLSWSLIASGIDMA
jgi:hypothetical protein